MSELAARHAHPDGTASLLAASDVQELLTQVPGWTIVDGRLSREIRVRNFAEALALVNRVGALAENENHHPDILLHRWNRVRVEFYTHSVEGLSENDFILAARVTDLYDRFQAGEG